MEEIVALNYHIRVTGVNYNEPKNDKWIYPNQPFFFWFFFFLGNEKFLTVAKNLKFWITNSMLFWKKKPMIEFFLEIFTKPGS